MGSSSGLDKEGRKRLKGVRTRLGWAVPSLICGNPSEAVAPVSLMLHSLGDCQSNAVASKQVATKTSKVFSKEKWSWKHRLLIAQQDVHSSPSSKCC